MVGEEFVSHLSQYGCAIGLLPEIAVLTDLIWAIEGETIF